VHRNAGCELHALGRLVTSTVMVGGAVHVGSRCGLIWGINSPCRGTSDGEVTGQGWTVRPCPCWTPTAAMATGGAAWGAGMVPLRGGAGFRVSAGWRLITGGQGRWLVEE
jgi:hypothetical protein